MVADGHRCLRWNARSNIYEKYNNQQWCGCVIKVVVDSRQWLQIMKKVYIGVS